MTVHPFPPDGLRRDVEDLRDALREVVEVVRLTLRDVSDGLVLQHVGDDVSRNHVDLIVSLQGTAQKLQQLTSRLQVAASSEDPGSSPVAPGRVYSLEHFRQSSFRLSDQLDPGERPD